MKKGFKIYRGREFLLITNVIDQILISIVCERQFWC